jgi:hypothetical protein
MLKITITGGPGSGKTSAAFAIRHILGQYGIVVEVPRGKEDPEEMEANWCPRLVGLADKDVEIKIIDALPEQRDLRRSDIPADWPVQPLGFKDAAEDKATCGACGLSWDDGKITSMTPVPGARCPFESFHITEEEE